MENCFCWMLHKILLDSAIILTFVNCTQLKLAFKIFCCTKPLQTLLECYCEDFFLSHSADLNYWKLDYPSCWHLKYSNAAYKFIFQLFIHRELTVLIIVIIKSLKIQKSISEVTVCSEQYIATLSYFCNRKIQKAMNES